MENEDLSQKFKIDANIDMLWLKYHSGENSYGVCCVPYRLHKDHLFVYQYDSRRVIALGGIREEDQELHMLVLGYDKYVIGASSTDAAKSILICSKENIPITHANLSRIVMDTFLESEEGDIREVLAKGRFKPGEVRFYRPVRD